MNIEWLKVITAAVFEVMWVIGLKYASTVMEWGGTLFAMYVSFHLLVMAGKNLPVGTAYAVFVGLGTAGTVLADIIFFGEPIKVMKIILILVLLIGVIGLKLAGDETPEKQKEVRM
ncbi:multidrug efflux SMR transporter [Alteribacillus sp. YIM 98480]|uniref:DMT family transporter n=1 Tax=Alteribacillus sp. YIM 98480 TaxID=2606599 RepID=UPI002714B538|nr:SMR family transporter [Alteribacillus sp. YIM 98480]